MKNPVERWEYTELKKALAQLILWLQGLKAEQERQSKLMEEKQIWKHKTIIIKLK